jgi:hypothetical protein
MIVCIIPTQKPDHVLNETIGKSLQESFSVAKIIYTQEKNIFECFNVSSPEWQKKYKYLPNDNDTLIFCHDDIQILSNKTQNHKSLEVLNDPAIGFIGVAGTTILDGEAVWWQKKMGQALHGVVYHIHEDYGLFLTSYGDNCFKPVVAMDGIFLAAKYWTIKKLGLTKPSFFEGDWDFYDIYYTSQAIQAGLCNLVVPIIVFHDSLGKPREGWFKNREGFIKNTPLPLTRRSYNYSTVSW